MNAPTRGTIRVDGELHGAIIKRIPEACVAAECFCGQLLRAWGLPVPEPIVVMDGEVKIFASLEAVYPSLKKNIGWHVDLPPQQRQVIERIGAAIACSLPDAARLLAADEAISNADRNLGNILWDGTEHAYIDHERTLGLVAHNHNLMAVFASLSGMEAELEQGAIAAALSLPNDVLETLAESDLIDAAPLVEYVKMRLPGLGMRILARFPKPKDLLQHTSP